MTPLRWLLLFTNFLLTASLPAATIRYTETARSAYQYVMQLRMKEAEQALLYIKKKDPQNLVSAHLDNYIDFLTLFTSDNPQQYALLKRNEEPRIRTIQTAHPQNPYFLYVQADIRMQWALLKFRFNEPFAAFLDLSRAYKLLKKNQALFPDFLPNYKNLGLIHALIGTIPDNYRWGLKLLGGISGTVKQGTSQLELTLRKSKQQDFIFQEETRLLYTYVLLYLANQGEKAWQILQSMSLNPSNNPLHCYALAGVAMQTGRNEAAVAILKNRPSNPRILPFPYLSFMYGNALLCTLSPEAPSAFQYFLSQYKGRNYIKDSYRKLAWHALVVRHDNEAYQQFMQQVLLKGTATIGVDKNALHEAQSGVLPHPALLKARLRYDGGYYREALDILAKVDTIRLQNPAHLLEYYYRKGRIFQSQQNFQAALANFDKTIASGKNDPAYYACNAALQCGLICEELHEIQKATEYFQLCLSISPEDYHASLHQSAKAGLNRLLD